MLRVTMENLASREEVGPKALLTTHALDDRRWDLRGLPDGRTTAHNSHNLESACQHGLVGEEPSVLVYLAGLTTLGGSRNHPFHVAADQKIDVRENEIGIHRIVTKGWVLSNDRLIHNLFGDLFTSVDVGGNLLFCSVFCKLSLRSRVDIFTFCLGFAVVAAAAMLLRTTLAMLLLPLTMFLGLAIRHTRAAERSKKPSSDIECYLGLVFDAPDVAICSLYGIIATYRPIYRPSVEYQSPYRAPIVNLLCS